MKALKYTFITACAVWIAYLAVNGAPQVAAGLAFVGAIWAIRKTADHYLPRKGNNHEQF